MKMMNGAIARMKVDGQFGTDCIPGGSVYYITWPNYISTINNKTTKFFSLYFIGAIYHLWYMVCQYRTTNMVYGISSNLFWIFKYTASS